MDQASSLLSFIATYASKWTASYIQNGYAQARLKGAILSDVPQNAAAMLKVLEESASLWPQGRIAYARSLADSAVLDGNISLKSTSSKELRDAASAVGSSLGNLPESQVSRLLGYVEESKTPTSNLSRQGFNFEGDAGVIVSDNGKSSTSPGGFWDGVDFNTVSDLLLALGGVASQILNGQPLPSNSSQPNVQNPNPSQSSSKFIRTALIVVGTIAVGLIGLILYKRLK